MFIRFAAGSARRPLSLVLLAALSPLGALAQAPASSPQALGQAPASQPATVGAPAPASLRTVTLKEALSLASAQSPDVAAARVGRLKGQQAVFRDRGHLVRRCGKGRAAGQRQHRQYRVDQSHEIPPWFDGVALGRRDEGALLAVPPG